jgi:hypothetical protein
MNPTEEHQCTNVYVANLPPSVDAPRLRQIFSAVGKVLHVKVLLDIATGVSRGIGFVMFEDLSTAKKACALKNKCIVDGCSLQVRLAERSSSHSSLDSHTRSSVVYIRNIPGLVTKEAVRAYCEQHFGPVQDIVPHPQSFELNGPSPFNMDIVTFASVDVACHCVEMIDGKAPFPLPTPNHPLTMAKMITDINGELRKSILLRRREPSLNSQPPSQTPSPSQASLMIGANSPNAVVLDPRLGVPQPVQISWSPPPLSLDMNGLIPIVPAPHPGPQLNVTPMWALSSGVPHPSVVFVPVPIQQYPQQY